MSDNSTTYILIMLMIISLSIAGISWKLSDQQRSILAPELDQTAKALCNNHDFYNQNFERCERLEINPYRIRGNNT